MPDDDEDSDDRPRRRRRPRLSEIDAEESDYDDDGDAPRRGRRYRDEEDDDLGQDAGMRMLIPIGLSGYAIAAGYLGLVSVLLLPAPAAIALGILGIRDIKRNPKKHGMVRCIFGITMGTICLLATAVAIVVAVIQK